jgi:hypothetical protein
MRARATLHVCESAVDWGFVRWDRRFDVARLLCKREGDGIGVPRQGPSGQDASDVVFEGGHVHVVYAVCCMNAW